MPKTIVCIIEEEMIMNYLFVKELYEDGDKVLFVTQFKYAPLVERYRSLFSGYIAPGNISSITLRRDGDEDLWDKICRTIRGELSSDQCYLVNLSGGTRLMSIAVQQVFERFNSKFYFMPIDRNVIIHSQIDDENDNDDDIILPIKHRVTVAEYLKVNGIASHSKPITQDESYCDDFFQIFTQQLSSKDYDIIDKLRECRERSVKFSEIKGLKQFIDYINFDSDSNEALSSLEVQFLTGNWFEEYIYYLVKRVVEPTDIAVGVDVQRIGSRNHNDIDVVFTLNNRLFAIECKTGVGRAALYNQIVYKACALKEALLGMRSNSYIFSVNDRNSANLSVTAKNMGITFCDRSYVENEQRLRNLFYNPNLYL